MNATIGALAVAALSQGGIAAIAEACHEVNAAYCRFLGDDSQLPWVEAPEWQRTSAINGVNFRLANPDAPDSASHDNWMAEKVADGWVYGEVKDPDKKTHPCIVPFDQLPKEQQLKDVLFGAVVHAMSLNKFGADQTQGALPASESLKELNEHLIGQLDKAEAKLAEVEASMAAMTAERDALQALVDTAAAVPAGKRSTRAAVKARKAGPVDNPASDALLEAIGAAELVELVFSDGKSELGGLAAIEVSGNAWAKVIGGVALRLPELLVPGAAAGASGWPLAGYALFLDGKQAAWGPRPETLVLGGGRQFNLREDVIFPAE